jgi:bacillithiol biosynthesis cysteine-adding enzyme BshC
MEVLDYRKLPASSGGFTDLFFDYLNDYQTVSEFYPRNFRDATSYGKVIQEVNLDASHREVLADVLREQNTAFGVRQKTLDHITMMRKGTTYAVVTGQQVGLFGGPLYTIFKTVTAVRLAEWLKGKYPFHDFVPVFWLEGEDHDFPEMNHTSLLDGENKPVRIEYLHGEELPDRNLGPVGELVLNQALAATMTSLENALQKTEFTAGLLQKIRECYAEGKTFNQAFVSWMLHLFPDQGIVFISPNHPRLKRLLTPMFQKEIHTFPETSQLVITQSAELEKTYHAQIKAKSINLFFFHKGGRYLIEPRETDFSLRGTRHFIPKDDLEKIARETPELLSTNVILRPIAQDMLLPTVSYVAGPSEVAYHAQLTPVYREFGIPQPVIYPRASASFVEERLRRVMEKYSLDLYEFYGDANKVTSKVVEQISEVKLDHIFASAARRLHESLNELRFGLKEVDPTLLGAFEGVTSKIDINMGVLKEKAVASQKRRNETAVRQIERAVNGLLPNGGLQERELNIIYYLNKYGPEVVKKILIDLDITAYGHQILTV